MNVLKIHNSINTDYFGIKQLFNFYNEASQYVNQTIAIDFYHLNWFDANLSTLLEAIIYKLHKDNNLIFTTDKTFLKSKFDVLFRNGFIKSEEIIEDVQQSTLPTKSFNCKDKKGFNDYVEHNLIAHRGMPTSLSSNDKTRIIDDLIEVFCNINHHSNTEDDLLFLGGQYFPKTALLILTIVDIGDGFLPKIEEATKNNEKITNSIDAIKWAVSGNSTKLMDDETPGGIGLKSIYEYCKTNNGELQVISGDAFWSSALENTIYNGGRHLNATFKGTTVNLFFNCK